MQKNEFINIMTSCDEKLARQLPVLLQSIAENITSHPINFFLVHRSVTKETIKRLQKQCAYYGRISFYEIFVSNPEAYDEIAKFGGGWPSEAYYSICAYQILPKEIDRVLYLDAGDTLVLQNIDEYYFSDFEGKSLLVTPGRYNIVDGRIVTFEAEDLGNRELLSGILNGIFNSGSYILNLEKLRIDGYTMEDYLFFSKKLVEITGISNRTYVGDQGFISAAYVGDIKYYAYPDIINLWYMPYDFGVWYYDCMQEQPPYIPCIIHFSGVKFKPWDGKYPIFLKEFQTEGSLRSLKE